MRIPLIYSVHSIQPNQNMLLDSSAGLHLARVLRKKVDDAILLFDGSGLHFPAKIIRIDKKTVEVRVDEGFDPGTESSLRIFLGQVMSKGDRMDWVVQKSGELGIHQLTPLESARSEVKLNGERRAKKQDHWQQIAISAAEQSRRAVPSEVTPIASITDWLQSVEADVKLILQPDRADKYDLRTAQETRTLALLIGPEGGFTESEVDQARQAGFRALTLGPRILRTETAPVAAISILQWSLGDLSKT